MITELRIHRRNRVGIATCGAPVKQDQLTDNLEDVNCPACWAAMRAAARA